MPSGSEAVSARVGRYGSYAELARAEVLGRDYRVLMLARDSPVLVIAPHGGRIEDGTSEVALAIAASDHSVFCFEGLKPDGRNRELHITSHLFDHPDCLALAARSSLVLAVHGCRGDACIHLGGRDRDLVDALARELGIAGFNVEAASRRYPGLHPRNICNRGTRGAGAQLELTYDLRSAEHTPRIAQAVRTALDAQRIRQGPRSTGPS